MMNTQKELFEIFQKKGNDFELLKRLILSVTNENDLVADFYLGSGTTAVVCKELNRRFVGCDVNSNAVKITNERLNGTLF